VAEKAAKSIAEMGEVDEDSESSAKEEEKTEEADTEQDSDDENAKLKKSALERLEGASEESLLSQASFFFFASYVQVIVHAHGDNVGNALMPLPT